jgi:hypothetical protein
VKEEHNREKQQSEEEARPDFNSYSLLIDVCYTNFSITKPKIRPKSE